MSTDEAIIAALMDSRTVREAAQRAEVSESTVYRRLRDPAFQTEYREARREVMSHTIARLQRAATDAVDALVAVVNDDKGNQAARVAAARTLLDKALQATELENIVPRIEALEQSVRRAA